MGCPRDIRQNGVACFHVDVPEGRNTVAMTSLYFIFFLINMP